MAPLGRMLIVIGLSIAAVGGLLLVGERLGFGRLPGDLSFEGRGFRVSIPIVSSILLSLLLTVLLNLFGRR